MKSQIIEQLGQTDILLPALIAEGLAANDRVKVRLGVLQAAVHHAREPRGARFDLANECRAAHLDPVALETLVNGASLIAGDRLAAPGLANLEAVIWDDIASMLRPIKVGNAAEGGKALERLTALKGAASQEAADTLELTHIAKLTGISDSDGDSLHRLVMDLHKALNRLAVVHATEALAGAHVHGLKPEDRPAVEAFMRGVESTRELKFNHPGLSTTASRTGTRLTIQNDIGKTDAHVVVIGVEDDTVTVTYTDVHLARAKFFTGELRKFPVQWSGLDRKSADGLGDNGVFYLVTGRFDADSAKERDAFLEAIGVSLVFLIDWNKARKVLQTWVSKADVDAGHRLGGASSLRPSRFPRTRRQRTGVVGGASCDANPHWLWRAAGPRARPRRGGRVPQDSAARIGGSAAGRRLRPARTRPH